MTDRLLEEQRENWGSRAGFVLAAVGSAVGLGNLWGFPYKVYEHGGGAFLIPYLIAMLLIGIPLMILEFSLGHMTQRAAPDAYRGINRRTEPVGWWGILLGFVIITYYPVILAWCLSYLGFCLQGIFQGGELPWAGQGFEGASKAHDFFFTSYLQHGTEGPAWSLGGLVTPIAIALGIVWVLMYLCIFRGVRIVGKVVLWTVPLPWIMLLILTIRGLTLSGAPEGLNYYLDPDFSKLADPETWRWGFGQMFFSMSLAFGVMITYASFLHRKSDINNNAMIIGLADVATSFVAGIAVFATLGAMAFATSQAGQAVPVDRLLAEGDGPGLAFVAFPYALAQLPWSAWFGAVFFIALLTLGIDSAFSITESVLAALVDKTGWNRTLTLIGMSAVGLGVGLVYCTNGGLNWIGTIDGFINSTWGGIALLGLLECVVVGWSYRLGRLREHANERSDWKLGPWWDGIIRYVAPLLLSALFTWSLLDQIAGDFLFTAGGELNVLILVGLIVAVAAPVLAVVLSVIPSPGADAHAAHVGQRRFGRGRGLAGTLIVALGAVGLGAAFYQVYALKHAGPEALTWWTASGFALPAAMVVLVGTIVVAFVGMATGAGGVTQAERSERRPSGLARIAAGVGVLVVGGAAGTLLSLRIEMDKLASPPARDGAAGNASTAATAAPGGTATELTGMSYLVLGLMVALIVLGLAWCFYRAIKASNGADEQEQIAEGME